MKREIIKTQNQITYNEAVFMAYLRILEFSKCSLAALHEEPLRQILEHSTNENITAGTIIGEFINALIYLRLECCEDNLYAIHYGYEQSERLTKYYPITSAFIRSVYRYTSKENTEIDIEECIRTDWVIINCAELFEYIGDRNKNFNTSTIKQLKNNYDQLKIA